MHSLCECPHRHGDGRPRGGSLSTFLCNELGLGSANTVESTLAQWLGFQAGRATWPLTTCTRAENVPEILLDSRTGARGKLGLQRTVAYVSSHCPQTTPHRLRCYSRASAPRAAHVAALTRALGLAQ